MEINILRGENQIGGSIIEIAAANTKIIFDVGLELDDEKNKELPRIDGLFDRAGYNAVFISHYHSDHMGLVYHVFGYIPVYMGEQSVKAVNASNRYLGRAPLSVQGFLEHKRPITVGDIKVTPYLCDHSAFDSYMLLAEADGETVLYTGDFRSGGRKSYAFLCRALPQQVDTLICEGTTLSRAPYRARSEQNLEEDAVKFFRAYRGPIFVLQSSMNIDRVVTMYRAAKRSDRIFLEDLYLAEITSAIGGSIPNPRGFSDVKVFVTRPYPSEHDRYQLFSEYGENRIGKTGIAKERFVMCVRSSMLNYLKSLNKQISFEDGLLVYSFWSGYRDHPEMQSFLDSCKDMGLKIQALHTSGHADEEAIQKLIATVNPKRILPIHTENAAWFDGTH